MSTRRRYSRFRPDVPDAAIITEAGTRVTAQVANESYGGLGLACADPTGLEEGQQVFISMEESQFEALIVSIRPLADSTTMIGIKWLEGDADDPLDLEDSET